MIASTLRRIAILGCVSAMGIGIAQSQQPSGAETAARVAEARARVDAIQARAARLADINEIENLQRSYGYYVDKMLWDHVVDLFAEDSTLEIGPSGVYVGQDSIRKYLYSLSNGQQGPIEGVLYNHMQLQPIVSLSADGQNAEGRWQALILTGESGAGSGGNWGEGPYENEYVKQNGVWKISKLHWYATFMAPYEGGWENASVEAVREYAMGRGVEPDRPPSENYAPFPGADVPPFHYPNPVTGE
jgi:hypothetical protein